MKTMEFDNQIFIDAIRSSVNECLKQQKIAFRDYYEADLLLLKCNSEKKDKIKARQKVINAKKEFEKCVEQTKKVKSLEILAISNHLK